MGFLIQMSIDLGFSRAIIQSWVCPWCITAFLSVKPPKTVTTEEHATQIEHFKAVIYMYAFIRVYAWRICLSFFFFTSLNRCICNTHHCNAAQWQQDLVNSRGGQYRTCSRQKAVCAAVFRKRPFCSDVVSCCTCDTQRVPVLSVWCLVEQLERQGDDWQAHVQSALLLWVLTGLP